MAHPQFQIQLLIRIIVLNPQLLQLQPQVAEKQVQVLVLIMPHPLKVPLEGQLVSVRRQALKITSESSLLNEMVAIHLGLVQETTEEDNLIASMKDIKCSSFSAHCVVVLLKNM